MLRPRVIPCLQMIGNSLVKTTRFKNPVYIGDPVNTVRIFNELEVDEICLLNIRASVGGAQPDYGLLQQISDECFCPLSYGGGIGDMATASKIFATGFEKIVINTAAWRHPALIESLASCFGSQAIVAAVDVKKSMFGKYMAFVQSGTIKMDIDAVSWAKTLERSGAGELLLTAIDREGTWQGLDVPLIRQMTQAVSIPVIAHGGAESIAGIAAAIHAGGASAVALGNMVVYQKKGMGVLVNFPEAGTLQQAIGQQ